MDIFYSKINAALATEFGAGNVFAGITPADACPGSVYYTVERYAGADDAQSVSMTVRARYFTDGLPTAEAGARVISALCGVMLGGGTLTLSKYDCKLCARYAELSLQYNVPAKLFYGGESGDIVLGDIAAGAVFGTPTISLSLI